MPRKMAGKSTERIMITPNTAVSNPGIATVLPSAGACSEQVRLFCGRVEEAGVGGIHGLAEEGEDIQVHQLPRETALSLLRRDRIPNGHTVIALQWLALNGDDLRRRWR